MAKNQSVMMQRWTGGANSLLPPDQIAPSQYSWAVNCVNRGGIVQTRPGFDCIASIQGKKVQGATIFTPKGSRPMMLVAVDGLIYAAKFPFTAFVKIEGLQFLATAPIVTFKKCLKSVKLNADETLELITPIPIVIIQDGETRAGSFDGNVGRHLRSEAPFYETPIGLWMAWTSSRLWVFDGSRGYVSDLAAPDTFRENTYLAERSNFELPGEVTGAIETTDERALFVFTDTTTTAFKSNVLDRTLWAQTPEFQKVILPEIGCVAGRSTVNQYGLTWWFSRSGFINIDSALNTKQTSSMSSNDDEMMRSKRILSPDLSTICANFYENYLLVSVPAGGRYNEQTWVADKGPEDGSSKPWAGIWTGARPVEWMKTSFAGRERIYFVSYDETAKDGTHIHVWEAFQSDRRDNDGRISCQMETAMVMAEELQRFQYAELEFCEILGPVELTVLVGGKKGAWHEIATTTFRAQVGSIGSPAQKIITKETILCSFKPQSREFKTENFTAQGRGCGGAETDDSPGIDKGFQLLIEWRGRLGVKRVKMVMAPDPSTDMGECKPGEAGKVNMLTDRGETIK